MPAEMHHDPWGRPHEARCDNCNASIYDALQERDFAAYHGGDRPFNDRERTDVRR